MNRKTKIIKFKNKKCFWGTCPGIEKIKIRKLKIQNCFFGRCASAVPADVEGCELVLARMHDEGVFPDAEAYNMLIEALCARGEYSALRSNLNLKP